MAISECGLRYSFPRHPANILTVLCLFMLLFPFITAAPPNSITGQQLLGSSFGIPGQNSTYDYLIVGGGTAGLALANRLSESGNYIVAVIEAGSFYEFDNSNVSQIPRYIWTGAGLGFDDVNPLVDWGIKTEPEQGIGGRRIHYTRGRTLGGSSARNNMLYQRATKGSYDKWAETVGDDGYLWENWKKYFDKSTKFHPADMSKRWANSTPDDDPAGKRAKNGPVDISYVNWVLPFTTWVRRATEALGMKSIPGFIDGDLIGTSWAVRTADAKTQVRESSETAYLRPALKRPNLIVYHSTMATRILFNDTVASGILCNSLGKDYGLSARKEVILSAGAFGSPQLLMVSGIGPREVLGKVGVPVLVDAPGVGQAMEDHPAVSVTHKVWLPSSTVLETSAKHEAAIKEFLGNGAGPLTSTGGDIVAFEKVPRRLLSNQTFAALAAASTDDWPDLEYITSSNYPDTPPEEGDLAGILVVLINTFSRGNVTISSPTAFDQAIVNVNFLTDPRDQEVAIAAIRRVREIFQHPSIASVVGPETIPGNATQTNEEILKYIQASGRTVSHVSCTCKMGTEGDKMAVVDSNARVFGVQHLRVVNVSAMPFLPPGHPMSTVYALAEKISDDILGRR